MEKKKYLKIKLLVPLLGCIILFLFIAKYSLGDVDRKVATESPKSTFWNYQCIDTMKTSRDRAASWNDKEDLESEIDFEMKAISDMGGNCVAIDTPYDEEFRDFLQKWVAGARKQNLRVWFRGNFSSWEGWFGHPKGMSSDELFNKSRNFIEHNSDLFQDGDVFTIAPEAENGGPFNQVETDEYYSYRRFLIDEYNVAKTSFEKIGKNVDVSWLSMNGGLAMRMLDAPTVDNIGNVVTIDHYIKTPLEMSQFIDYFNNKFGAKVVIGEFGAPIPDINGPMDEDTQAEFVDKLFRELKSRKDKVIGVSYWDLIDGSTALLNQDGSSRNVVDVVRKYFIPAEIHGTVRDNFGRPLQNLPIVINNGGGITKTDNKGNYSFLLTQGNYTVSYGDNQKYILSQKDLLIETGAKKKVNIALKINNRNIYEKIRSQFLEVIMNFKNFKPSK